MSTPQHCLNMKSVFGFNKDLPGGVHSLFDESREAVVYPSSHTLVYFDCSLQKQTFLQGHASQISAIAVSNDKKWIVSGDAGRQQTLIIVWNVETKLPVRTYQLKKSVLRIDLSDDGALIGVLTDSEPTQELHLYEWSSPSEFPAVATEIDQQLGFQRDLRFNPADFRELISNSPSRTVFWEWEEIIFNNKTVSRLNFSAPEINSNEFKTLPSAFTVSCYLPKTTAALTATVNGEVVLYDLQTKSQQQNQNATQLKKERQAIKLLTLHTASQSSKQILPTQEISAKSESIMLEPPSVDFMIPGANYYKLAKTYQQKELLIQQFYQYLTQAQMASQQMTSTATQSFTQAITYMHAKHDGFIITGGLDGAVRMFDFRLRLLSWYENLEAGPITSVSIVMPLSSQIDNQLLSQAAVQLLPGTTPREVENKQEQLKQQFGSVILRDFIVGTQRGSVILVPAAVFELVEPEKRRGQNLYQGVPGNVTATHTPKFMNQSHLQQNVKENISHPVQYIATDRGDLIQFDYTNNQITKSVNLVGDINATGGGAKSRGTLAQRHLEGFEQASYLLPIHPGQKIKTMRYSFITCLEMSSQVEKPILLCGTSLGTCLILDPVNLQLLSSFTHLSQLRQVKAPPYFKNEGREIILQIPVSIKFVRISQGDVVAAVDEMSQLTLLNKTQVNRTSMDPITGKINNNEEEPQNFNNTVNNSILQSSTPLQIEILKSPPKFVTEFEDESDKNEKRTVTQVRIHPAALLARANQRRRDAASTAGQWQNLGKVLISHAGVVSCDFLPFKLYDEIRNELKKDQKREPLVIVAKDRFITIVDVEQTINQIEPDKIVVDRRFRSDQEAVPTAVCFLKKPRLCLDESQNLEKELQKQKDNSLKTEINAAMLSLQSSRAGLLNATIRPELQPVDQRDLLLVANNQYKIQMRQLQRFNQSVEISNRTILSPQQIQQLSQQTAYFSQGYPTQYPMIQQNIAANSGIVPYIPGGVYGLNTRLAGPLPLRRTVVGPTFAGYLSQIVAIEEEMADNDEFSQQVVNERFQYRTDYEILNQTGAVRHKCQYLVFSTPQKVIGMARTPLDGSPHKYVGLIASAGELLQVDVSYASKSQFGNTFVISAGKQDCCTFLFQVNYSVLDLMIDTAVAVQQNQFDPFLNQLDGAAEGDFYTLIQEYFSYAQIYIAEQKGLSPSEEPRAPVSMLPEILRALNIYLNNEQMQNATAELIEEDLRIRRLKNYLQIVKKAFGEKRLPCPFDQRENLSMICDLNPKAEIKPFFNQEIEDINSQQTKWEEDGEFNEQFEQSLFEVVGAQEITMSLQDLVRIIVNYRQLSKISYRNIKIAFEQLGAKDRVSFQENMALYGEKIESGDLMDMLQLCQQEGQVILPEAINADEFVQKFLKLDLDVQDDYEEYEEQEENSGFDQTTSKEVEVEDIKESELIESENE